MQPAVYLINPSILNLFMKMLTRPRFLRMISASCGRQTAAQAARALAEEALNSWPEPCVLYSGLSLL